MEKNVGHLDRMMRLTLGPLLVLVGGLGLTGIVSVGSTTARAVLAAAFLVGAVLLVTGTTKRCLINEVLGIDTYRGDTEATDG